MRLELLYRVQAVSGAHHKDGMVISYAEPGFHWTPAEWQAYVDDSNNKPPGWLQIKESKRRGYRRLRARLKFAENRTDEELRTARFGPGDTSDESLQEVAEMRAACLDAHNKVLLMGEDTNWGFKDLKHFGVMIADLDDVELDDLLVPKVQLGANPFRNQRTRAKRKKIVNYKSVLSAGSVTDLEDPAKHIIPKRKQTPMVFADFQADYDGEDIDLEDVP